MKKILKFILKFFGFKPREQKPVKFFIREHGKTEWVEMLCEEGIEFKVKCKQKY